MLHLAKAVDVYQRTIWPEAVRIIRILLCALNTLLKSKNKIINFIEYPGHISKPETFTMFNMEPPHKY